jgi:hypothetical protein
VTSFSASGDKCRLKISCNKEYLIFFGRFNGECWEFNARKLNNHKYIQHTKGVNKENYKEYIKNIGNISAQYIIHGESEEKL